MAVYTLNTNWGDVDAVAAAFANGDLIEKRKQSPEEPRNVLPVSASADGKLFARSSMVYSFENYSGYEEFLTDFPDVIRDGDQIWVKETTSGGGNEYTLYQYSPTGLLKVITIVSEKLDAGSTGVVSVNGKTGRVTLTAQDVDAQPAGDIGVKSFNGKSGDIQYHNEVYADYTEDWIANDALHIRLEEYLFGLPVGAYYIISHSQEDGGEIFFRHTTRNGVSWREMEHYVYGTGTVVLKRWENENLISSAELATTYYVENALAGFEGGGGTGGAVSSVNGKVGAVVLGAEDVEAVPSTGGEFTGEVRVKAKVGTRYVRATTSGAVEFNDTQADNGFYVYADEGATDRPVMSFYGSNADSPVALRNVAEPTQSNEAATKGYVDATIENYVNEAILGGEW